MKRAIISLPNRGSGRISRSKFECLRDIDLLPSVLGALGAILGATLATIGDAGGIKAAAHGVITHTGKVLDTAATNQHHRVLLKVVPLTTDVATHLVAVGQAHTRDLAKGRVRLLRRGGVHSGAHAALLR